MTKAMNNDDIIAENVETMPDEEVAHISKLIMEQNQEAYEALAK